VRDYTSARPWTEREDNIIRDVYPDGGWQPVAEATGRGKDAIKGRASRLKVFMTASKRKADYQKQAEHMRTEKAGQKAYMWDGRPERSVVNDALTMRW